MRGRPYVAPYEKGSLTEEELLEKAWKISLRSDGRTKLVRFTGSEWGSTDGGWFVIEGEYFLSRSGWRKYSAKGEGFYPEELKYSRALVPFETAMAAADFYFSHCTDLAKPEFDLKVMQLRDYLRNEFRIEDWEKSVKSAIAVQSK
jgi:hypothetical protein